MKLSTYEIEWNLERFHWWFVGRRNLLKSLLASISPHHDSFTIDIGCGVGSNFAALNEKNHRALGIDSELYALRFARKRNPMVSLVNGDVRQLPLKTNSISLILATDLLEHIEDDTTAIRELFRVLKKNGTVILTVPAFTFLWGTQDVIGMHKRRYSRKEITEKMRLEGFRIRRSSYFNSILFIPILLARRLISLLRLNIRSENELTIPIVNSFLMLIFSFETHLLKYASFPLGVSIFCIAQKR